LRACEGARELYRYAAIGAKGDRYEENGIRHSAHTFDCSLLACGTTIDNHSGTA
jgi:hypothetical protein